jgi:hypothetical protein
VPIAILVLALVAYAYALVTEPGFRRWGLLGGAAAGLGLAIYFWVTAPEATRSELRIPPDEIVLDGLVLETSQRGAVLTGRVTNGSPDFRLREMTLRLALHDCPGTEVDLPDCPVIGDATAIARPDVPPGQVRGFSAHFIFSNLPPVSGVLRWEHGIVETRATD